MALVPKKRNAPTTNERNLDEMLRLSRKLAKVEADNAALRAMLRKHAVIKTDYYRCVECGHVINEPNWHNKDCALNALLKGGK